MRVFLVHILIFMKLIPAFASVSSDTARAIIGEKAIIPVIIDYDGNQTETFSFSASFTLSNPTVFYPEVFYGVDDEPIPDSRLERINDSSYIIETFPEYDTVSGKYVFSIFGEALAGNDSVCVLRFTNVKVEDQQQNDFTAVLITESSGPHYPYVRFIELEQNYPNPVRAGELTTFPLLIDKTSDIKYIIFDLNGQVVKKDILEALESGIHQIIYRIPPTMSVGTYWIIIESSSGRANKRFQIWK